MSVIVSHPTGNPFLRAVLRGLEKEKLLSLFFTTLAIPETLQMRWLLGENIDRRFDQRRFPEVPWNKMRLCPSLELVRLAARVLKNNSLITHETGWASADSVYRVLDQKLANFLQLKPTEFCAIYAYEDGALETFRVAEQIGVTKIYDLPIAHWRTLRHLLKEEAERLPEWAPTMPGLRDSVEKCARKDEEIEIADHIFVASSFTRNSIIDHFGDSLQISTVPYGCPPVKVKRPRERLAEEPLRLFYAGHLSQRKGIADLIEALNRLEIDWQLTLAGPLPEQYPLVLERFLGNPRCNWLGVVPHQTLLEAMTQAHVFVFPSIVEGFGMVITEAMAAGLAIITTSHTAGPDIITEGHDGFIVPIRDPSAIAERITLLAENETLRYEIATNALQTAENLTWSTYESSIAKIVSGLISP